MKRLLVIGGGFAGLWAALGAARQAWLHGAALDITLLSRDDFLVLRPRLYEASPSRYRVALRPTLDAAGVRLLEGTATAIDAAGRSVECRGPEGDPAHIGYDQLVIASGSRLRELPVPGLQQNGWNVDTHDASLALNRHLKGVLDAHADEAARTVVVAGAGFTGIELVTALRERIALLAGAQAAQAARIVLVDRHEGSAGGRWGGASAPVEQALQRERVEQRVGRSLAEVAPAFARLDDGERIATRTVVAATGMIASGLGATLGAPCDGLGRLHTDAMLRVPGLQGVIAAGDAAHAVLDEDGRAALMCCQHAITMGRFAGRNAASALLGLPLVPYRQPYYVTCLDLGASGAAFTTGWERRLRLPLHAGKRMKQGILEAIEPPRGTREELLAAASTEGDFGALMEQRIAALGGGTPRAA